MGINKRVKTNMIHCMYRKVQCLKFDKLVDDITKMEQDRKNSKDPWFQSKENTNTTCKTSIEDIISDLMNNLSIQTAYTGHIPTQVDGYEDPWFEIMLNKKSTCKACRRSNNKMCFTHSNVKGRKIPYVRPNGHPVKQYTLNKTN